MNIRLTAFVVRSTKAHVHVRDFCCNGSSSSRLRQGKFSGNTKFRTFNFDISTF